MRASKYYSVFPPFYNKGVRTAHYGGTSYFLESLSDSAAFLTTQKLRRGRGLVPAEVEDKGEEYLEKDGGKTTERIKACPNQVRTDGSRRICSEFEKAEFRLPFPSSGNCSWFLPTRLLLLLPTEQPQILILDTIARFFHSRN